MEENFNSNFIEDYLNKIQERKDQLLREIIIDKIGMHLDLVEESKRMFPRLKAVINNTVGAEAEHWYWNDGSIYGKLLISFLKKDIFDSNTARVDIEVKYY